MATRRYSEEFRQAAVERLKGSENIVALAQALGGIAATARQAAR